MTKYYFDLFLFNCQMLILISFLIPTSIFAEGKWITQNPLPTESFLLTVEPVTDKIVFIGGLGGTLLKTMDGGETWQVSKFKDMVNIRGVCFNDSRNGWIMDSEKLRRTNDGGANWNDVNINIDLSIYGFLDIACFNNVIYLSVKPMTAVLEELIYANSLLLKSEDGGETWIQLDLDIQGRMRCAFFLNESYGFLYTEEIRSYSESYCFFYKTIDGGKTWEKSRFPENYFSLGMHFINENLGFIGKYRTTDGGKNWEDCLEEYLGEYKNIDDLCFADSLNGWAVNWSKILQTNDGGLSWQFVEQTGSHRLMDINLSPDGDCWVVGWACNIFNKKSNSDIWKSFSTGPKYGFRDIFFIDKNQGWCVGTSGCIMHTENGGEVWEQQQSNVNNLLFHVKFLNHLQGFAVGYEVALYTEDGGETWCKYNDLNGWYTDIDFFDDMCGLITERYGNVHRTTNGGKDWQVIAELSRQLTSVEIINENEAWIGGAGGLAHTTNKGEDIRWIDYPNLSIVQDIQFFDKENGWLLDDDDIVQSALFSTQDCGKTWQKLPRGKGIYDGPITAFSIQDPLSGWIYSYGGYLHHIIPNQTLSVIEADDYFIHAINRIFFINQETGWAVGEGGSILKYTVDNESPEPALQKKRINIFPNPLCKTGAYIFFTLSQKQHVKIQIFNTIGQKVQTIYDGWLNEGDKTLFWMPSNLSSGVYFVSVQCDEFNQAEKCTHINH